VVADEYKDQQALSALVLHAMAEAVVEGREFWNWGGTWRSQEGVYRFKNRFGAIDKTYRYFFRLLQPSLSEMSGSTARQEFPYFYTHRYTS
jgi:lipid II:glycine glycyltransferase (peptidoglycan interpeptide bridge formation enzyme)